MSQCGAVCPRREPSFRTHIQCLIVSCTHIVSWHPGAPSDLCIRCFFNMNVIGAAFRRFQIHIRVWKLSIAEVFWSVGFLTSILGHHCSILDHGFGECTSDAFSTSDSVRHSQVSSTNNAECRDAVSHASLASPMQIAAARTSRVSCTRCIFSCLRDAHSRAPSQVPVFVEVHHLPSSSLPTEGNNVAPCVHIYGRGLQRSSTSFGYGLNT